MLDFRSEKNRRRICKENFYQDGKLVNLDREISGLVYAINQLDFCYTTFSSSGKLYYLSHIPFNVFFDNGELYLTNGIPFNKQFPIPSDDLLFSIQLSKVNLAISNTNQGLEYLSSLQRFIRCQNRHNTPIHMQCLQSNSEIISQSIVFFQDYRSFVPKFDPEKSNFSYEQVKNIDMKKTENILELTKISKRYVKKAVYTPD